MLTIEHLSVEYYRRGQGIPAVRDVSLSIGPGEAVGLVGESGSGKSTMALAILRLIRPQEGRITAGRILFKGQDLLRESDEGIRQIRGAKIAMIFQDPFTSLNPVMTIREQMEEVLVAHSEQAASSQQQAVPSSPLAARRSLEDALSRVQLDPRRVLDSYPHQLSGGQRQRVLIATALLTQPDVVLADEPTTALDVLVQKEILDLLFGLQKEMRMSLLFISHNLGLVAEYTQKIAVMKDGKIVEEGNSRQVFDAPKHAYTRDLLAALPAMTRRR